MSYLRNQRSAIVDQAHENGHVNLHPSQSNNDSLSRLSTQANRPEPVNSSETTQNCPANASDLSLNHSTTIALASPLSTTSLRELKKNYHMRKKYFTKNVQSAIESTQEVHSGWLKARTNFKRWTKVWCQVKPGYLILYTSQEALKKHRLGVVLLSVCQVIKRPTKKEGFCFKLINPFGCSVWAKSSTKALVFAQASLTLRVSDNSIGGLWLDALHRCLLSSNLQGYQAEVDENGFTRDTSNISDSDNEGDHSLHHLESMLNQGNSTSDINSTASLKNSHNSLAITDIPSTNGNMASINIDRNKETNNSSGVYFDRATRFDNCPHNKIGSKEFIASSSQSNNETVKTNDNIRPASKIEPTASSSSAIKKLTIANNLNLNSSKMVAKFSKYYWKELQLERVNYIQDGVEELGDVGIQSEEVHESNKNLLWHIIKQMRPGMDLSKVTLPTFILEPRSFLEKLADYYYHCDILSDAVLIDDPVMRLVNIVKWYLSGFYKKPKGPKKPYNPILGERFRCFWEHPRTKSRTFFVAEQVSHHPPISAFHVANRKDGYTISCALLSRSKYTGNSVSAILDGKARLYLSKRNETYTITMPYANCRGILLGQLTLELGGKVEIECAETGCKCELDFKLASMWASSSSYNTLSGKILKGNKVTHTLDGHWDKKIDIVDKSTDKKSTLWEVTDVVRNSRLKRYTVRLKDQEERESVRLWSKVTAALGDGNQIEATAEKTRLEDLQRKEARERLGAFKPQHFELSNLGTHDFAYKWIDNRAWNERRDIIQFEEDFRVRTLMMENEPMSISYNPNIDLPLTQLSRFASEVKELVVDVERAQSKEGARTVSLSEFSPDTIKSIESKIAAGNMLFEEAIKQVTEKNRKLEEDIAILKHARGKRTMALLMTALVVALISAYYGYFA